MNLYTEIAEWDLKDAGFIASVYDRCSHDAGFLDDLFKFMREPELQQGASWLIKKNIETVGKLDEKHLDVFFSQFDELIHWETKLHYLQCLPFLEIPTKYKSALHKFLGTNIKAEEKFVRAWCYGGYIILSDQYEEYREEVRSIIALAEDEAASIKARIRQAVKKSNYWRNEYT